LQDNDCLLAVNVVSNVVAKGTIQGVAEDITRVTVDVALQGLAELPIPIEEEFIMEVNDAVGHILSWPSHLVIRCSDLVIKIIFNTCSYLFFGNLNTQN
jgi:hypothetical protein